MSRNVKISGALVALFAAIVVVVAIVTGGNEKPASSKSAQATPTATAGASGTRVVAADPRRLGPAGNGGVTFTEFLDFECEACGAAFPAIEQLRKQYAGRVTFNIRYFPIESHRNARNAALAVEAAAQQGKLEPMYRRMYEKQTEWAEQKTSKATVFRRYAAGLGLDMKAYDAAVKDPKTLARVQRDVRAGEALGVEGTPSFFINERRIQPQSLDELRQALDAAIAA